MSTDECPSLLDILDLLQFPNESELKNIIPSDSESQMFLSDSDSLQTNQPSDSEKKLLTQQPETTNGEQRDTSDALSQSEISSTNSESDQPNSLLESNEQKSSSEYSDESFSVDSELSNELAAKKKLLTYNSEMTLNSDTDSTLAESDYEVNTESTITDYEADTESINSQKS